MSSQALQRLLSPTEHQDTNITLHVTVKTDTEPEAIYLSQRTGGGQDRAAGPRVSYGRLAPRRCAARADGSNSARRAVWTTPKPRAAWSYQGQLNSC